MTDIEQQPAFSPLETLIREKIRQRGAITVAEYMELALGHEQYGYYMTRDPFGEHGDFTTAPEISQIFGELIGVWLAAMWQLLGSKDMLLVELGPGRGTLLNDALRATRHVSGFHESLVITLVESSYKLRRFQRATMSGVHPRIAWQSNLESLPDLPMLFIANEFFDALPIRQYVKTPAGLQERLVTIDEHTNDLTFVIQPMGLQLVKGGGKFAPDSQNDENIVESSPAVRQIITELGHHLKEFGGAGLMIDYGYAGESRGNSLQSVKNHGFWPVLKSPGEADITAHVAFDDIATTFKELGIHAAPLETQGRFLQRIGGNLRLEHLVAEAKSEEQRQQIVSGYERLISSQQMGELFKVMGVCSNKTIHLPGFNHHDH